MKRIIDGKRYDTETAMHICKLPCDAEFRSDFAWHNTNLYRSPAGVFFAAGEGNAMSMWAKTGDGRSWSGGSGLRLVSDDEAQAYAEAAGLDPDIFEQVFGAAAIG